MGGGKLTIGGSDPALEEVERIQKKDEGMSAIKNVDPIPEDDLPQHQTDSLHKTWSFWLDSCLA